MNIESLININKDEKVFLDTNILIFLFSPSFVYSEEWQINKYNQIVSKLLDNGNMMYINSHVVSEFINRCLRIDFDKNFNQNKDKNFKNDYRKSSDYDHALRIILAELKKILSITSTVNDDFVSFDILLEYKNNAQLDFNDLIIARTVINNNLMLLSDDRDFNNFKGLNKVNL